MSGEGIRFSGPEALLLQAIATSLRNQVVMMQAMALHLGSMAELRVRIQSTIELLAELAELPDIVQD
jgi:hypothetical protein